MWGAASNILAQRAAGAPEEEEEKVLEGVTAGRTKLVWALTLSVLLVASMVLSVFGMKSAQAHTLGGNSVNENSNGGEIIVYADFTRYERRFATVVTRGTCTIAIGARAARASGFTTTRTRR